MISLINKVLSLIIGAFGLKTDLENQFKEESKRQIGYDLFELYCAFVELIENGNRLLLELKRVIVRLETEPAYSFSSYFVDIVEHQYSLLITIMRSFGNLREELKIVDKKSYLKLVSLMHSKFGYFGQIIWGLKDSLLLTFDVDVFESIENAYIENYLKKNEGLDYFNHERQVKKILGTEDILCGVPLKKNSNDNTTFIWNEEQQNIVKEFLDDENQSNLLKEIDEQISELYESLKKNFSIDDILVGVRKRANEKGHTPYVF
jgi:hypothetical protein